MNKKNDRHSTYCKCKKKDDEYEERDGMFEFVCVGDARCWHSFLRGGDSDI